MGRLSKLICCLGILAMGAAVGCAQMETASKVLSMAQTAANVMSNAPAAADSAAAAGQTAAVAAIPTTLPAGVQAVANDVTATTGIPVSVQAATDSFTTSAGINWGKPRAIVVTDTQYILVYPTPAGEQQAGRVRMIVVDRNNGVAQVGMAGH